MALPLAKLGLIVGAGELKIEMDLLAQSLLKKGKCPMQRTSYQGCSRLLSSNLVRGEHDVKPRNDSLMEQFLTFYKVNNLRQELELLSLNTNKAMVVVTGSGKSFFFFLFQPQRTKIERIEGKQDATNIGVMQLVGVANDMKNKKASAAVQALPKTPSPSGQTLQRRQLVSSLQHTRSLPPPELSASRNSDEIQQVPATPLLSRRQDLQVDSDASLGERGYPDSLNESRIQEVPANDEPSSSSKFGKLFSGFGSTIRMRSAVVTKISSCETSRLGFVPELELNYFG